MEKLDMPREIENLIELEELSKKKKAMLKEQLQQFVVEQREKAVAHRASTGIEKMWDEDNNYYNGVDKFNTGVQFTKARGPDGGLMTNEAPSGGANGCTEFFNITRPFVDAASARMGDILLPSGDWNFRIKPTPVPELIEFKDSDKPVRDEEGNLIMRQGFIPKTVNDFVSELAVEADRKVAKAEMRIRDWLVECSYHAEVRKVFEDAARIGTGVLKGAVSVRRTSRVKHEDGFEVKHSIVPASFRIDPVNFFPDPDCGDNIQSGNYVIERDYLTTSQLYELGQGDPTYDEEAIDKVIKEGVNRCNLTDEGLPNGNTTKQTDRFEIWYYYGNIDAEQFQAVNTANRNGDEDGDTESIDEVPFKGSVPAVIVMVNSTVIKSFLNPLGEYNNFPYDVMPWQAVSGSVWGIGVARQGRVAQKKYLVAARSAVDNMSLSSIPMLVIRKQLVRPMDGDWTLRRGKIFAVSEEGALKSVSDAIVPIVIPSLQEELAAEMQIALKMMEDTTGVNFLLQGQQGSAPDTVGGMQLLHQNASALLRRVARLFDERVTEPHIRRYYEWLLKYGDDDDEKGDVRIEAIGSSALLERELQAQQLQVILQMAENPEFGLSKKKVAMEMLKSWKFDPAAFAMDNAEIEAVRNAPPPPMVEVEAAKVRSEANKEIAQLKAEVEKLRIQKDIDRDAVYSQGVAERNEMANATKIAQLELKRELELLRYANDNQMTLDKIKADLAKEGMKLGVQKDLAMASAQLQREVKTKESS